MHSKKYTSGFCSSCHKNVPHRRWVGNPILLVLDLLTLRIARWLRIGPWYCIHCDGKSSLLPLRRPDAIDYRSAALGNEMEPIRRRKRKGVPSPSGFKSSSPSPESRPETTFPVASQPVAESPTALPPLDHVEAELEPAESIGNFIKTDSSLLLKSKRLQRYSEKYRDAVVRRILTGDSSIKQVREEKQLSESEITDWIADLFERQQQRIDALELFKNSISQAELLVEESFHNSAVNSESILGKVRPR